MKIRAVVILLLLLGVPGLAQTNAMKAGNVSAGNVVYTCPMHPQIVRNKPGDCPIFGMKLEIVKADKKKK